MRLRGIERERKHVVIRVLESNIVVGWVGRLFSMACGMYMHMSICVVVAIIFLYRLGKCLTFFPMVPDSVIFTFHFFKTVFFYCCCSFCCWQFAS